jgi:hypothetical protein
MVALLASAFEIGISGWQDTYGNEWKDCDIETMRGRRQILVHVECSTSDTMILPSFKSSLMW